MAKCELCEGNACKNEKPIKVSFCPKCKSTYVKYVFEFGNIFGVLPKMRCQKCGLEAQTFPLLVTNKKLLSKSVKGKKAKKKTVKKINKGGKK